MCCIVLQCIAGSKENSIESSFVSMCIHHMCCSVLQCVAVRCSVLQCVAVCCRVPEVATREATRAVLYLCVYIPCAAVCCSVSQCVARYRM